MSSPTVVRMVLSFYLQNHYYRSLIALEQDSKIRLFSHGNEIDFFYDLITQGKFEDVERLVETVKEKSTLAHSRIVGYIRKERLMEVLDGQVMPEAEDLASALKEIEGLMTREEYEELCRTLGSELEQGKWDVWKGRYLCFQDCLKCLQELYTLSPPDNPPLSLLTALNGLILTPPPKEIIRYSSDSSLDASSPAPDIRQIPVDRRSPRPVQVSDFTGNPGLNTGLMGKIDPTRVVEIAKVVDTQAIRAGIFSPQGDQVAIATKSKSLCLYSLPDSTASVSPSNLDLDLLMQVDNLHQGSIYCIDWSVQGSLIATGSNDRTVQILVMSEEGRTDMRCISGLTGTVRCLCFHPLDQSMLLSSGDGDGVITLWQSETLHSIHNFPGHPGGTPSISSASDGSFLVSGGHDRCMRVWDLRSNKCMQQVNTGIFGDINSVALNCTSKVVVRSAQVLAAAAHSDGVVSVWDLTAGRLFSKHNFHRESCRYVSFSSDSKWLASASFDHSIGLTSIETGDSYRVQEHKGKVVSVHWHPRLPVILSTSADKTARVVRIGS